MVGSTVLAGAQISTAEPEASRIAAALGGETDRLEPGTVSRLIGRYPQRDEVKETTYQRRVFGECRALS